MMEDHLNTMRREAERVFARNTTWAVGTVDSYDKQTHAAKIKLQPEGVLSGWLPLNSLAVGNGFGIHGAPKVGDPVLVHFQDGDREAGVIMGRFFTDQHAPVPVEEGEYLLQHETKTKVFFKKDGTLLIQYEDKNTTLQFDQDGQVLLTHDSGTKLTLDKDKQATLEQASGTKVKLDTAGNVGVKPASGKDVYLGDLPDGSSTFSKVLTVAGPAAHVLAAV